VGFVGVETEYGIAVTGPEEVHPVRASALLVAAHRDLVGGHVGWDYTEERPDRDARSTPLRPEPPELTIGEPGTANLVLTNGARLYVDHAHPEYATPECAGARDLVVWDVAGERIVEAAARNAERALPEGSTVHVHKNNTDGKGAAYGTHENYLVDRSIPFGLLTRHLLPMFVSRIALIGAGRVGSEHDAELAVPALAAGRLLRGGGRARDDDASTDHEHSRRAARGSGPLPTPARHQR
jgi:Pup amidohydrolase